MAVQSAPYYWLTCDGEGCGIKSTWEGEFAAWADEGQAQSDALDSGWFIIYATDGGELHYCENCRYKYVCTECDQAKDEPTAEMCTKCAEMDLADPADIHPDIPQLVTD